MIFRTGAPVLFLFAFLLSACSSSDPSAPKKSFWKSISDFFSPAEEVRGDGELERELSEMEKEIHETEWKYSRENRPQKKSRYKAHLERLRASRDSLELVISQVSSSSGKALSSTSLSSSEKLSSSSNAISSSSGAECAALTRTDSVFVTTTVTRVVHDTVFIRDTVLVRDTVRILDSTYRPESHTN